MQCAVEEEDVHKTTHCQATGAGCKHLGAHQHGVAQRPAAHLKHYRVHVCGRQIGDKERQYSLSVMKRNRTGGVRVERPGKVVVKSRPMLLLSALSGSRG